MPVWRRAHAPGVVLPEAGGVRLGAGTHLHQLRHRFRDHYVYQGNFSGFMIWDVKDPAKPVLLSTVVCVTSQGDPSIIGNLLFISAEGGANRNDCAKGGVENPPIT